MPRGRARIRPAASLASGQAIPSGGRWQLILSRLAALRAREEEDQEILEDLERLLQDA